MNAPAQMPQYPHTLATYLLLAHIQTGIGGQTVVKQEEPKKAPHMSICWCS